MRIRNFLFILLCLAAVCRLLLYDAISAQTDNVYVQNEILVQFTPEGEAMLVELYKEEIAEDESIWDFIGSLNPFRKSRLKTPEGKAYKQLSDEIGIHSIQPDPTTLDIADAPTIKLGISDLPPHLAKYDNRTFKIMFDTGDVDSVVEKFKQLDYVKHAQPNFIYTASKSPNDPYFSSGQHELTNAIEAWDSTTGSNTIIVAVLDSGVDYTHEDLQDNMISGFGYNALLDTNDPMDVGFHGTAVAGVAGAVGDNAKGIAGVVWDVQIMAVRVGNAVEMDSFAIERGTKYAADHGARIINMSFGGPDRCNTDVGQEEDVVLEDAISYATRAKNVLIVAAAGNESANAACSDPANHPDVLAVAGLEHDGSVYNDSNYASLSWKSSKIIAAPMGSPSTYPGNQYIEFSGTSAAAPYVSGAAALVLSKNPRLSPFELRKLLIDTAEEWDGSDDGNWTYGKRINLALALGLESDEEIPAPTPTPTPFGNDTEDPTPTPQGDNPTPTLTPVPDEDAEPDELGGQTQQVDWVYEGVGRCWSAWADNSCSLSAHEGGAYESLRDLDSDGTVDITCSQGDGSGRSTTITNVSSRDIIISCERYACTGCASGDGSYARCDQSIDASAAKVSDPVTISAGCTATCTLSGATGSCIDEDEPEVPVPPTPTPTLVPDGEDSEDPTPTPTPLPDARSRAELPLMISAQHYQSDYKPVYVYGWFTDRFLEGKSEIAQNEELRRQLAQIKSQDATKMMMFSSYETVQRTLQNYASELHDAGVTVIGYNMELAVGTPQTEMNAMHTADETNSVVRMIHLAKQYGFEVVWGPIRENAVLAGRESQRSEAVRLMNEAGLKGVAFQEQKFIETQTAENRRDAVIADVEAYKKITGEDFEIYVQIMSSRCGSSPWSRCMQFLDYVAPSVDGIAIWASGGSDVNNLPSFITTIRGT